MAGNHRDKYQELDFAQPRRQKYARCRVQQIKSCARPRLGRDDNFAVARVARLPRPMPGVDDFKGDRMQTSCVFAGGEMEPDSQNKHPNQDLSLHFLIKLVPDKNKRSHNCILHPGLLEKTMLNNTNQPRRGLTNAEQYYVKGSWQTGQISAIALTVLTQMPRETGFSEN